jgi:hypothetical protein
VPKVDGSKKWLSNQSMSGIEKLLPVTESNRLNSFSTSSVGVKNNEYFDIYCLNKSLDLDSLDDEEFDDLEYVFESSSTSSSDNDEPDKMVNNYNIKEEEIEADFTEITQQTNLKLDKLASESLCANVQVENDFKTVSTDWLDSGNIGGEYSEWYQGGPTDLSCKSCGKISLNDSTLSDITEISDLNLSEYEADEGVDLSEINSQKMQKESLLQNLKQLSAKAKLIYEHLNGRIELLKDDEKTLSKYESKTKKKAFEQFIFAPVPISKEYSSTQKLNASFASNEASSLNTNSISKKPSNKSSNRLKMPFKYFSSNIIEATKRLFPFRNHSNTKLPTPQPPQTFNHYSDTFSNNKTTSTIFDSTHTLEENEQVKIEVNHFLRQKCLSKKEPISFNIKISITY